MSNIFIIHGAYGHPGANWIPWLKKELKKLGHDVFVPHFPTPRDQNLENWLNIFDKYKDKLQDSIMVGHSLGVPFILRVLEKYNKPIKTAFFVAGFASSIEHPDFTEINRSFVEPEFDWSKIKDNCKNFYLWHSNNDPYVPLKYGEEIAKNLDIKLELIKNAGHFNHESDYNEIEFLLEKMKQC